MPGVAEWVLLLLVLTTHDMAKASNPGVSISPSLGVLTTLNGWGEPTHGLYKNLAEHLEFAIAAGIPGEASDDAKTLEAQTKVGSCCVLVMQVTSGTCTAPLQGLLLSC